jgi:hypothetical protein
MIPLSFLLFFATAYGSTPDSATAVGIMLLLLVLEIIPEMPFAARNEAYSTDAANALGT